LDRNLLMQNIHRIVIKIGSSVLTDAEGRPDPAAFQSIVDQTMTLATRGIEAVLVSSGAVASGQALLRESRPNPTIPEKQALAAIGQSGLMGMYQQALDPYGKRTAQVLLTREDLTSRNRYLHARNTLFQLLRFGALPVINENDTVMVDEIKIGDNDSLSARVALLVDADLLVLLTDAPGLCLPSDLPVAERTPIPFIERITREIQALATGPASRLGTGGMVTKLEAARITTQAGIPAVIAPGRMPQAIVDLLQGRQIGTWVAACSDRLTHKKHWIAHTLPCRGTLILDDGAIDALVHRGRSLLPSGVVASQGAFENGDMVACTDRSGREWARGITHYSSAEVAKIAGRNSSEIESVLGYRIRDEVIHRDELVVLKEAGLPTQTAPKRKCTRKGGSR
jgi:glutamate 5-kinase